MQTPWRRARAAALAAALLACAAPAAAHAQAADEPEGIFITASDGVGLYVETGGQGPPVLFLHGGPGQGSLSFRRMGGSALEEFATVMYLDQRGSGRSDSARDYHLPRVLRDIDEVRAALGHDKVYLLAHSFGGILAVNYAAEYPEHVEGIILAAATLHFLSDSLLAEQAEFIGGLIGEPRRVDPGVGRDSLLVLDEVMRTALNRAGLGYRLIADSVSTIARMSAIDRSYPRAREFGGSVLRRENEYPEYYRDYAPLTRSISVPVLVIGATRDHAVGPRHFESFRFPEQHVVRVDGSHLFYYEQNDAFTGAIREFLR